MFKINYESDLNTGEKPFVYIAHQRHFPLTSLIEVTLKIRLTGTN